MKVLAVIGTRPDAIKMAPIIKRLQKTKSIELVLLSTNQHTDLLASVLEEFKIQPDFCFDLKREKTGLSSLVSELTKNFDELLPTIRPDIVLGHGDTASCFAAALSCFHQGLKFFHIEAGLRSHDLTSPYPEEFYRQSISKMTHTHFCPDEDSKNNLLKEGIKSSSVIISGNTIEESLSYALGHETIKEEIGDYVLMTIHRREKTDGDFIKLQEIILRHPSKKFIFIGHPNPELKVKAEKYLNHLPNIKVLLPQSYFQCAHLVKFARVVLTDSGGIQEEASLLNKPLIIFRSKSEREVSGDNKLLSLDVEVIDQAIEDFFKINFEQKVKINIFSKSISPSSFVESVLLGGMKCMN